MNVRAIICLLVVLLGAPSCRSEADGESAIPDPQVLNACIVAAIEDGAGWPRSPVEVLNHLFSLQPDCVVPTTGILNAATAIDDSSAVLVFRHSLSRHPGEAQWLQAQLATEVDGTWRVRVISPYHEAQRREAEQRKKDTRLLGIHMTGFDTDLGPSGLLEFLKEKRGGWIAPLFPKEWIKESDLPGLVNLLHSAEPCAGVISMVSSVIDSTTSTVGNEAAYLLEGYIEGRYPPRLISTRPRSNVREIELWWSKRQER